jgi:REP element-mobilizing transposase RayT
MATSNHIHLLVKDRGHNEIPKSVQLVAGRVAQEFNQRKKRKGAFWEDRYHATAIASDQHFATTRGLANQQVNRTGDRGVVPEEGSTKLCQHAAVGYHPVGARKIGMT